MTPVGLVPSRFAMTFLLSVTACNQTKFSGSMEPGKRYAVAQLSPTPNLTKNELDVSGIPQNTPIAGTLQPMPVVPMKTTIPTKIPLPDPPAPAPLPPTLNPQPPLPTAQPSQIPSVAPAPQTATLTLRIERLNYDAWFKSCMYVSVTNISGMTPIRIGCNKDTAAGTIVTIPVHKEECNVLRLRADTYKNVSNSCHQNAAGGWDCAYNAAPDYQRITGDDTRLYFEVFDATQLSNILAQPGFSRLVRPRSQPSLAQNLVLNGYSKAIRIFYEDNLYSIVRPYIDGQWSNPTTEQQQAIDYDDYVIDIKAENGVRFTIEGSNTYAGTPAPNTGVAQIPCE